MATYYVDFVNGSNANNGLGPDASHATNKPWKTIAKLIGASGMASGDTAYLSPAGPFREVVTAAMTAATAETKITGDPENKQGFKTSGGVAVAPGPVIWTAYTTNDKTAPSSTALLTTAGRHFLTFQYITMVAGGATNPALINAFTFTHDLTFKDCLFLSGKGNGIVMCYFEGSAGAANNLLIDRCIVKCSVQNAVGGVFMIELPRHSADYDCGITIRNTIIYGGGSPGAFRIVSTGAGSGKGGGAKIRNCTMYGALIGVSCGDANLSTTFPVLVNNCVIDCGQALVANTSGQITESYNWLNPVSPRSNVTAGTGSISDGSYALLAEFGQTQFFGSSLRPFYEPSAGSPLLGFGNDGNQTAYDLRNKLRPAGGVSASPAAGALERANTFGKETGTVRTGSNAISITGPGYQEFLIPVDATSTTISVYVRWDATYAGTKPQLQIDANGEIGVAAETKTATGSSGSWEQLTLSAITPTVAGIVTVRVLSNDTNGGGHMYVDDWAVA